MSKNAEKIISWVLISVVVFVGWRQFGDRIRLPGFGRPTFTLPAELSPVAASALESLKGPTAKVDAMTLAGYFEALGHLIADDARREQPTITSRQIFKDRMLSIGDRTIGDGWSIGSRYGDLVPVITGHLDSIAEWPEGRQRASQKLSELSVVFAYVSSKS